MRKPHTLYLLAAAVLLALLYSGCVGTSSDITGLSFDEIENQSRGSTVTFYMWGGDARINGWVDGFLADELRRENDITLKRVPEDAAVFVNKLIAEKQAGREKGSIDLLWINGENFKNAKQADVLHGPVTQILPNFARYIDADTVTHDFGHPVDGYEVPYGRAQFVFEYDSAKTPLPPRSFAELTGWVKDNPGRFTYPQPPSFTGSAFIRQALYAVAGGHEQFMSGFDETLYREKSELLWEYLDGLEPYLWERGMTYPKEKAALDTLFIRGEIDINMSYHQADAQGRILSGQYRNSVKTFVMEEGSLFNTHFTAIPFNAPNKKGAVAAANLLLSPRVQSHKNDPGNWGDFTVLDMTTLTSVERSLFDLLDLGPATLRLEVLESAAVPEIPSDFLEVLESDWERHVLRN